MSDVKESLRNAVSQVRANGGWIIVTFQDGHVHSLEPNILFYDELFAATDTHGDMISFCMSMSKL
jgi:prepilin-type processing-associated H-X9-DG protein